MDDHKAPLVIGLTGGIASGKTTAAKAFKALGVSYVDADDVAREVVEPGEPALQQISTHFGPSVIHQNGTLNRAALREKIFADKSDRVWLESLLHPLIRQRIESYLEQFKQAKPAYVMLVSPLLLETSQRDMVDRITVVDIPESLQRERVLARDNVSTTQVEAILAAQLPREERLAAADDVIDNSGDNQHLKQQIEALDVRYRKLYQANA